MAVPYLIRTLARLSPEMCPTAAQAPARQHALGMGRPAGRELQLLRLSEVAVPPQQAAAKLKVSAAGSGLLGVRLGRLCLVPCIAKRGYRQQIEI